MPEPSPEQVILQEIENEAAALGRLESIRVVGGRPKGARLSLLAGLRRRAMRMGVSLSEIGEATGRGWRRHELGLASAEVENHG